MNSNELKELIERIKFDYPSFAACLGIPYHTLRNYVYGSNAIPSSIERKAREIEQINLTFMQELPARVDERVKREFPCGIMSDAA